MKIPPSINLPQGVRDILPQEAERICSVESSILSVFRRYGFKRVVTPLLEYVDVLSLGMGEELKGKVLKFIDPSTGRVMAIRPDITPQIARLVSSRMRDYTLPLKLCYNEGVLRYGEDGRGKLREVLQVGAEYISKECSPKIDAEMIVTAIEALKESGVKEFKIDIGDVGFVKGILDSIKADEPSKKEIKDKIKKKDTEGLKTLLDGFGGKLKIDEKALLLSLTTSYGEEEVINKAISSSKDASLKNSLVYLKKVIAIINKKGYKGLITIDLGEVRGFDYYTGIIFEGFARGVGRPIVGGGRYDTLLSRYGYDVKSSGFAFDVEAVVEAVEGNG